MIDSEYPGRIGPRSHGRPEFMETNDFMAVDCVHVKYDMLARISNRIINEVRGIARVAYHVSSKSPATIE